MASFLVYKKIFGGVVSWNLMKVFAKKNMTE